MDDFLCLPGLDPGFIHGLEQFNVVWIPHQVPMASSANGIKCQWHQVPEDNNLNPSDFA